MPTDVNTLQDKLRDTQNELDETKTKLVKTIQVRRGLVFISSISFSVNRMKLVASIRKQLWARVVSIRVSYKRQDEKFCTLSFTGPNAIVCKSYGYKQFPVGTKLSDALVFGPSSRQVTHVEYWCSRFLIHWEYWCDFLEFMVAYCRSPSADLSCGPPFCSTSKWKLMRICQYSICQYSIWGYVNEEGRYVNIQGMKL